VILKWRVDEVSPVPRGAGVSTGTHSVCCGSCSRELADLPPAADVVLLSGKEDLQPQQPHKVTLMGGGGLFSRFD
jgi:hypothetical protein